MGREGHGLYPMNDNGERMCDFANLTVLSLEGHFSSIKTSTKQHGHLQMATLSHKLITFSSMANGEVFCKM